MSTSKVRLKILTAGDQFVGKSVLIKRYCEKKFFNKYKPTIGIDYGTKMFKHKDKEYKIDFWDVSGLNEFKEVRTEFYVNTDVVCFVFFVFVFINFYFCI